MRTIPDTFASLNFTELNAEAKNYFQIHQKRYIYLMQQVKNLRSNLPPGRNTILDIGPSLFTKLLEKEFPSDDILSLGYEHEKSRGGHLPEKIELEKSRFYNFNLNEVQEPSKQIELPVCDIMIMAEVIEHLYTSPLLVLRYLNKFLKPGGYLIVQTPNAAALKNRIQMLIGRNPFHMIRENADNPGHFREYTIKELSAVAAKTGFIVIRWEILSYFNPANIFEKLYVKTTSLLPQKLRDGITIILRKPE